MFGEKYVLIASLDSSGKKKEQWVVENRIDQPTEYIDPSLVEPAGNCNTDKDKYVRKSKIAGINIVSYPCGTILSMEELFGSESLSQVLLPVQSLMKYEAIRDNVKGAVTNHLLSQ